jgi:topoisomerase IA-like protein
MAIVVTFAYFTKGGSTSEVTTEQLDSLLIEQQASGYDTQDSLRKASREAAKSAARDYKKTDKKPRKATGKRATSRPAEAPTPSPIDRPVK